MVAQATDKIDTEERIFEAALEIFAKKGRDGARMQEIADLAGINKAMLHYYFRSKDLLYEKVFDYVFYRYIETTGEEFKGQLSFKESLRNFIDVFIDRIEANPNVVRLMINENLSGGVYLQRHFEKNKDRKSSAPPNLFLLRLKEAMKNGEIRKVDPFHTLVSLKSLCIFFFVTLPMQGLLDKRVKNRKKYIAGRKQHIFDLLYHGLKAE